MACEMHQKEKTIDHVQLSINDSTQNIDIHIDGQFFTTYMFNDSILRKPVLYPILTANQIRITRGYPIDPIAGERIDHPHHYGLWFNHGDVNNVDYWNSALVPRKEGVRYGRIKHQQINNMTSGDIGVLSVEKIWIDDSGNKILQELTEYTFSGSSQSRSIDIQTQLTAINEDVLFKDSKEGMLALRVRRELELSSEKATQFLDVEMKATDKILPDNSKVTGTYINSNGLSGYPDVWGKRAAWMQLKGMAENDSISICIFDHNANPNHPPHWMARDYGLFGVNSFGSNIYTEGEEQMDFKLSKGDSVNFKHAILIHNTAIPEVQEIEKLNQLFQEN